MEEWRQIPGYEGCYAVSNYGHVRSLDRINSQGQRVRGRLLAPDVSPSGHLRVTVCKGGKTRRFWVHRLVLDLFVGPRPAGTEGCHNDGDPANNRVENLRWDTKKANARDRRLHGRDRNARKTHCPNGHEYNQENTYVTSHNGWRRCRKCTLVWQRETRIRRKQERS